MCNFQTRLVQFTDQKKAKIELEFDLNFPQI